MTTETRSRNWPLIVIVVISLLLMVIAYFIHDRNKVEKQRDAALKEADDFFVMGHDDGLFRLSEIAKQDSIIFAYKDSLKNCRNGH